MEHISENVSKAARNIELVGADKFTEKGFTQVPNHILEEPNLSPAAKLTYAMLLRYAWDKHYCFPGQATLAKDIRIGKRSVIRFMAELEKAGYIEVKRQGLGKTNLYKLFQTVTKPNKAKRGRT